MKRLLLIIIIAVCVLNACTHQGYTIKGELADANGMKIVLMKMVANSDPVRVDSTIVRRGKFRMRGNVEFPEYCLLYAGDNGPLGLFVENTLIEIDLNVNNIHESVVSGSKENYLFVEFNNKMAEFDENLRKINDDYMAMRLSEKTDIEKENDFIAQMDALRRQRIEYMKQFAAENPNSIVTAMMINNNLSHYVLPEELELLANGFDEINSKSSWVQSIMEKNEIARRIEIGQPFVDFIMSAPDGNEIALSNFVGNGNYVLIDFWASWCVLCRIANPRMVEIYNKYRDKGFEIVSVSLDRNKIEWTNAIETDRLIWQHMSDLEYWHSEGARLYSVNRLRHTVLLDKDGIIIAKGLKNDELDEKLEELFRQKYAQQPSAFY